MAESSPISPFPPGQQGQQNLMQYLHHLSGQKKDQNIMEIDHTYAKAWNKHPDPSIKSRPAKFLFMKDFPRQHARRDYIQPYVDVENVEQDKMEKLYGSNPFVAEVHQLLPRTPTTPLLTPGLPTDEVQLYQDKMPVDKSNWSQNQSRLWTKVLKILQSDRLSRLVCEGRSNEMIIRRNLLEKSASRFRQAFASIVHWEVNHLSWLHSMLHTHITPIYLATYHEAMQLLRTKLPALVDRFYVPLKIESDSARHKQLQSDPIQAVLNNYRPKRINGSPLFLIVPNGPQIPHHFTSQRMKHWHNLFGSLGKVITVTVTQKSYAPARDCLYEIRLAVKDKIKECKATFNEGRPLVLVGFGTSSLIAAHCALENQQGVTATVCLGFPLTGVNGFRGDLDDPLLESTVPTLFVIGQQSSMCTLDDMEDFRERITKAETGLVVVGGCTDRLIVSGVKKRTDGITQGIVDRCIADEIYEFISCVINPNHVTTDNYGQTPTRSPSGAKSPASGGAKLNKTSPLAAVPTVPASTSALRAAEARRRKNSRSKSESKYSEEEPVDEEEAVAQENLEKPLKERSERRRDRKRDRKSERRSRPKKLKITIGDSTTDSELPLPTPASGRSSANASPVPKRPRLSSSGDATPVTGSGRNSANASPTPRTPTPRTPKDRTPATSRTPTPAPAAIPEESEATIPVDHIKTEPLTPSASDTPASTSRPATPPSTAEAPGTPAIDRLAQMTYSTITTTVNSASTRRGRTIRAPKQLDI